MLFFYGATSSTPYGNDQNENRPGSVKVSVLSDVNERVDGYIGAVQICDVSVF